MSTKLMNISPQNIAGTCESKCSYSFNYPSTNATTITNYGSYLQFTYDLSNTSPVLYNNNSYNVSNINIYSPSLHQYNSTTVDGEVVIRHTPIKGGNPLYVIIPISSNGITTRGTQIVSNIISNASKSAPSAGKSTNKGVNNFTLNDFIPMKQFYSYTTSQMDCVVFDISNAIGINTNDLTLFKKIVSSRPSNPFQVSTSLFINTRGPSNTLGGGSDIFIDCQPTDQVTGDVMQDKKTSTDVDLLNSPYTVYILYLLGFIFLIVIVYFSIVSFSNFASNYETPPMKGGFFKKYK